MCFARPCARMCARATTVAAGGLGRRPRHFWGTILLESPSQTSLEMYHRRRHRATPGRGASLRARARSEAISLLLARKKCLKNADEMLFAGTGSRLSRAPVANGAGAAAMLERTPALAAGGVVQSMARQLSPLALGQFSGAIGSGVDRCVVCGRL